MSCNKDNGRDFLKGLYLRMWCNSAFPKGIVDIEGIGSYNVIDGDWYYSGITVTDSSAPWTSTESHCKIGYLVCGYQIY